jgi:hypothetical protein
LLPPQLTAESFKAYPPKGQSLAVTNLALFQDLPLGFAPFLLREVLVFDWKFPYEQSELTNQLAYLTKLLSGQRKRTMEPFAELKLNEKLEGFDWVNQPAQFLEQLSAHLWATQQMDGFREASESYIRKFYDSLPVEKPPIPRLGIVVFGEGVKATSYKLFRKLRSKGVYFTAVRPEKGAEAIVNVLKTRSAEHNAPFAHWCIEGSATDASMPGFACVSYDSLAPIRSKLSAMMLAAYESPKFDPEKLRTMLAEATPKSVGMPDSGDGALDRFRLSLLTEGSGTQIYSTTFVQWAAREALRRAHPLTIYARFTPRQKERTMNELLIAGVQKNVATDPEGSLIDADMAAFYTWINFQRLPDADAVRFLVWFEGHKEALAIAPGLKAGTEDATPIEMSALLAKLS